MAAAARSPIPWPSDSVEVPKSRMQIIRACAVVGGRLVGLIRAETADGQTSVVSLVCGSAGVDRLAVLLHCLGASQGHELLGRAKAVALGRAGCRDIRLQGGQVAVQLA